MFYLSFLSVSLPASYTEDYRIYLDLNGDKKEIICKVLLYAKINNKKIRMEWLGRDPQIYFHYSFSLKSHPLVSKFSILIPKFQPSTSNHRLGFSIRIVYCSSQSICFNPDLWISP